MKKSAVGVYMLSNKLRVSKGFTLIELLIVVLILGVLSAIAVPRIVASAQNAKTRTCETNVDRINSQIELFRSVNGRAPTSLSEVTSSTDYFPDGSPICPFNGRYILNRLTGHVICTHSKEAIPVPVEPEPVPVEPEPLPVSPVK